MIEVIIQENMLEIGVIVSTVVGIALMGTKVNIGMSFSYLIF